MAHKNGTASASRNCQICIPERLISKTWFGMANCQKRSSGNICHDIKRSASLRRRLYREDRLVCGFASNAYGPFIFGLGTVNDMCGSRDNPQEVFKYKRVRLYSKGDINIYTWVNYRSDGTGIVDLQFLLSRIRKANISLDALSDTVDLSCLSDRMKVFKLIQNLLTGVDLTGLPSCMNRPLKIREFPNTPEKDRR